MRNTKNCLGGPKWSNFREDSVYTLRGYLWLKILHTKKNWNSSLIPQNVIFEYHKPDIFLSRARLTKKFPLFVWSNLKRKHCYKLPGTTSSIVETTKMAEAVTGCWIVFFHNIGYVQKVSCFQIDICEGKDQRNVWRNIHLCSFHGPSSYLANTEMQYWDERMNK